MKLNNGGFTLVELLATIVIFAIVAGLGAFSVTAIIKNSKQKNYELLVKNIKDAAEVYYQECKYDMSKELKEADRGNYCFLAGDRYYVKLGNLVKYGHLTGNSKLESYISIYYNAKNKYEIKNESGTDNSCPTEY